VINDVVERQLPGTEEKIKKKHLTRRISNIEGHSSEYRGEKFSSRREERKGEGLNFVGEST